MTFQTIFPDTLSINIFLIHNQIHEVFFLIKITNILLFLCIIKHKKMFSIWQNYKTQKKVMRERKFFISSGISLMVDLSNC